VDARIKAHVPLVQYSWWHRIGPASARLSRI